MMRKLLNFVLLLVFMITIACSKPISGDYSGIYIGDYSYYNAKSKSVVRHRDAHALYLKSDSTFMIPRATRSDCHITVCNNGTTMSRQFDKEGLAEFKIKKHEFKYDNLFSVLIHPNVDPFKRHMSWGDNETLSYVELYLFRYENVLLDSSLSGLDIMLPSFPDDLFQRWIIADDVVLKTDEGLVWRGNLFVKEGLHTDGR